ncbi:MAG: CRISPR-associated endonuclease Cas1 [Deltaproteobacteria bacterium]|jgi:CRISPR-associated protein Cas1|nr:CRISPR-associated endonuclease Cas1 [Deltaproteobacteria bacterium]
MSVAYVMEQNATIGLESERLVVKKDRAVLHSLLLFKLEQLVLFGNVFLTPAAVSALLHREIDTVFMSLGGSYRGRLQPPLGKNISLRCEQFRKMQDGDFCLRAANSIVCGKIANCRTVLLRLNRNREGLGLEDNILSLKLLAQKAAEAEGMEALRGFEGRGAVVYFEGFSKGFLAEGVTFRKRVRRPPTDPVNALLSLGYTLLFNAVMAAVALVGFDPYLGCLHTVEYGRPSLALDLMEEWRPLIVDSLVLSLFNLRTLTLDDFERGPREEDEGGLDSMADPPAGGPDEDNGAGRSPVKLTADGYRKFITHFERKMAEKIQYAPTGQQLSYRDCIREQARYFARWVRGEEDAYRPIQAR